MALFHDRWDAGLRLGEVLAALELRDPLILGIPRGGVVTAAAIAEVLDGELDVVLVRKLRAPGQPEFAIGAVAENGEVLLHPGAIEVSGATDSYVQREGATQREELRRRGERIRAIRRRATLAGRSVVVTDDGVATGATLEAALRWARTQRPAELIVAVPVAPPRFAESVRELCDRVICLESPPWFAAVGQFYDRFDQVDDETVLRLLASSDEGPPRT